MAPTSKLVTGAFASLLALVQLAAAYPGADFSALAEREITGDQLLDSYDFVIVGGGQSGLVIGSRLSEDTRNKVLVVEYGYIERNPAILPPSSVSWNKAHLMYNVTSIPQPGINNRTSSILAAATAGGGSAVNGAMLERGSPMDYDNWEALGNPGWSFRSLLQYFKKSSSLTPPTRELVKEFGVTYDQSAYGKDSPIQLSYASYQYPATKVLYKGMLEAGVKPQKEQGLNKYGLVWYPSAFGGENVTRSYSVVEYLDPAASRSNLHFLPNTRVNEVLFDKKKHAYGVTLASLPAGGAVKTVQAAKEIVLTAGFLHTPQILQRSGVGPAALLKRAGVRVVVDLPGVGSNYQDHPVGSASFNYTMDLLPNPASLTSNETFKAWADELWATNHTGPRSIGVGMVGSWLPLKDLAPKDYKQIAASLLKQDPAAYLPKTYTKEQIAGYKKQRELIAKSYLSDKSGQIELPFGGGSRFSLSVEHPTSRGLIVLNTTDVYAEPVVDYGVFNNPIDPLIVAKAYNFVRRWVATKAFQTLGPVELTPGTALQTDDELVAFARNSSGATTAHGCCTAHMAPRQLGGVVSHELLVYGVTGLSVGDISTIPLVPNSHTCSTVYAIAEKAADLIKARHRRSYS